jgi:hypothetical protein
MSDDSVAREQVNILHSVTAGADCKLKQQRWLISNEYPGSRKKDASKDHLRRDICHAVLTNSGP